MPIRHPANLQCPLCRPMQSNEQAKLRVEEYVATPSGRDVEGLNAQLVDALGRTPIEGIPYALRFEGVIVKAGETKDYGVDGDGRVTFYTLITASSNEEREAMLARGGEAEQALKTALCDSFVPMESISAVNVMAVEVTMSAASNDTVISGEVTVNLGSARSDKEARDKFRKLDLGEMSKNTHGLLVKELNELQGDNTLFSVTNVEVTGVFTTKSNSDLGAAGQMARVSTVLQNVGFDENGFHDKTRAYCAFEELYEQDLAFQVTPFPAYQAHTLCVCPHLQTRPERTAHLRSSMHKT
ncbi:hypothetical protein DUNSADRAFT_12990 [Dunaliella salina]|uniref:Uncharacterized protein n=1 Tax=Dunaliella salina TaxID=3046 RepID=A0ABQ7GAB1_DUNSA|nr:hypothetical protein DUNSADRAFT_12990 [Dunaliella salina]|eukprot:KAF5831543.1 hypothetical protein DUNSADRAFT_12990 [Dunaliella salina]